MAKNSKIVLEEQGVVTHEALLAYAESRLSADDIITLEKLLANDPFAQEALEGLMALANRNQLLSRVSTINQRVQQKSNFKTRKKIKTFQIHWATYAYAAAILAVLVGLGVVLINFVGKQNEQVALKAEEETPQEPAQTTVIDSINTTASVADTVPLVQPANNLAAAPTGNTAAPTNTLDAAKNATNVVPPLANLQADATKETNLPQPIAQRVNEAATPAEAAAAPVAKPRTGNENFRNEDGRIVVMDKNIAEAEKAKLENTPTLEDARKAFEQGKYAEAQKRYEEILHTQPGNSDALYFGAICNYILGNNNKAEENFTKLLNRGLYVHGSKWYKANILLRKGKTEDAKELFRELSNTNNDFRDRAIKKFEEIK